jgi:hypothetical protein
MRSLERVFIDDGENMCPIFIHLDLRLTLLLSGYFTVSVSMVLWLNEPEVPVKVRVKVPGAVAGLGGELLPTPPTAQPAQNINTNMATLEICHP